MVGLYTGEARYTERLRRMDARGRRDRVQVSRGQVRTFLAAVALLLMLCTLAFSGAMRAVNAGSETKLAGGTETETVSDTVLSR